MGIDDLERRARGFDVICAGEAMLKVADNDAAKVRPGGGAVNAALRLAREGLRVGLATVLSDDTGGRSIQREVAGCGIDAGGVVLAPSTRGILFVRGGARQVVPFREEEEPVRIPEQWASRVLLLSGMSPVVAHSAALCKAARAARRAGTVVVMDVNVRWDLWRGRDARSIRMVLREADVVWCSAHDLFGLNMDVHEMRAALRPNAVLVASNASGLTTASGPFGEVTCRGPGTVAAVDEGDRFTTAICAELARVDHAHEGSLWRRALERGHARATR